MMDIEIIKRVHGIGHSGKKKIKDIIEKDYYINKLKPYNKTDSKIETFSNRHLEKQH